MHNPLNFNQTGKTPSAVNIGYVELCNGKTWRDEMLRDIAQRRQEDFYAAWVGEMIRIAKPGKPIIVEEVSLPKCVSHGDWGTLFVTRCYLLLCSVRLAHDHVLSFLFVF